MQFLLLGVNFCIIFLIGCNAKVGSQPSPFDSATAAVPASSADIAEVTSGSDADQFPLASPPCAPLTEPVALFSDLNNPIAIGSALGQMYLGLQSTMGLYQRAESIISFRFRPASYAPLTRISILSESSTGGSAYRELSISLCPADFSDSVPMNCKAINGSAISPSGVGGLSARLTENPSYCALSASRDYYINVRRRPGDVGPAAFMLKLNPY